MNLSIRFKLFIYMTVNIILFAILLYGSNTFFAEKYYISQKEHLLVQTGQKLLKLVDGKTTPEDFNDENLIYEINTLEKSIGGSIFIGTSDGTLFYPVQNGRNVPPRPGFPINPFYAPDKEQNPPGGLDLMILDQHKTRVKKWERYDDKSFFIITQDPNFKIDTLRYQIQLDSGLILLVWVPMAEITESASISNDFTAIVGLITVMITGIWALFISGKFTHPITEMNKITKKMAELDFSQTLKIDGEDEIGQLSRSINHLSHKLSEAIRELNDRNRRLEEDIERERKLDKMRREFISSVSHELKTPVFLIQGYAEGLKAGIADDKKKRDFYCDVIMEEAEKMDTLVKDLLTLSQIESGMFPVKKIPFNVSQLIKEIIFKYKPVLDEKGIHIEVDTEEALMAYADPARIEEAVVNFMNNAIDHVDEKKIIKLTAKPADQKIRISVYNSGMAIPEEALDKVWHSFYKVDKARKRALGGTGLGLAIVKAIQEAHKNAYGVANVDGGVEFWIELDKSDPGFIEF
ncbi:sensor histidine kinase [Calorimonas adulescens]|uniref:histidine kinase n=1 Tax=Calorimonas adulescens TaxID=2606906 RepID=A0A5D8QA10_9THEO|nr:sensor histidine kinase [Calorimonas adulescens]TZE81420.1 cell wall metabolism sensor histidine kinase WalK [Calorimonas adulescens]